MKRISRWDVLRARFINSRIGAAILATIVVTGALATVLQNLSKIEKVLEGVGGPPHVTLKVAPLTIGSTVQPLAGYPVIRSGKVQSLAGGFKFTLGMSHGHEASQSIILTSIEPIVQYIPPKELALPTYEVDAAKLPPAGLLVTPGEFFMRIAGPTVKEAYWFEGPSKTPIEASASNLLETHPPRVVQLNPGTDDSATLTGSVRVSTAGTYDVSFRLHYLVAGRIESQQTAFIRVIMNE